MSHALFLCNRTQVMPQPWLDAGVRCVTVDVQEAEGTHPLREHVRCEVGRYQAGGPPLFVAAFPPCTDLAVSGARWYRGKGLKGLIAALQTVEDCG